MFTKPQPSWRRRLRRAALLTAAALSWPRAAAAVVAVDRVSEHDTDRFVASFSFDHTVGAGPDRLLVVAVIDGLRNTYVTAITYGGANLTRVGRTQGLYVASEIWLLVAPTTGTRPVFVTMNDASDRPMAAALSYTGVDQADPVKRTAGAMGMGRNVSVLLTTQPGELVLDAAGTWTEQGGVPVATAAAGQAARWSFGNRVEFRVMGSEKVAAGAATAMGWTMSLTTYWATQAVAIRPAQATPPPDAGPDAADGPPSPRADGPPGDTNAAPLPSDGGAPDVRLTEDARGEPPGRPLQVHLNVATACRVSRPSDQPPIPSLVVVTAAAILTVLRTRFRRR